MDMGVDFHARGNSVRCLGDVEISAVTGFYEPSSSESRIATELDKRWLCSSLLRIAQQAAASTVSLLRLSATGKLRRRHAPLLDSPRRG